nr:hypothetical protein [uncultured Anaerosporobacter sp.]
MSFEGLGQAIYSDARKIALLEVFIELVETGQCTHRDALAKLHISKEDFDTAAAQIKLFDKSDKDNEYQQFMKFRDDCQDLLGKMDDL